MRTIQPLHDQVLIRRRDAESISPGGVVIPEIAKKESIEGEVLAVGQGRMLDDGTIRIFGPEDPRPGDHVIFSKYAGMEVTYGGEKYLLVRWSEILAVYRD